MRYLLLSLTVLAAALAAVLATVALASNGSTQRAQVAVAQTSPVVITGAGFKKREHLTVTVASKTTQTKRLYAGPRGGFRTMFRGLAIPPCTEYTIRAKGNRGSLATLHVIPECPSQ